MFRVWENYASDPRDRGRFRVEVLFSPGADSLLHSAGGEGGLSVDTVHLDTAPLVSLTVQNVLVAVFMVTIFWCTCYNGV